ncbi:MAG: hypothetical protein ACYC27_14790 [Armatimonadota bacterium]
MAEMTQEERERIIAEAAEFGFEEFAVNSGLKTIYIKRPDMAVGIGSREMWDRLKRLLPGEPMPDGTDGSYGTNMADEPKMIRSLYIKSRCCDANWKLTYETGTDHWDLACQRCGKPIGDEIKLEGPVINPRIIYPSEE